MRELKEKCSQEEGSLQNNIEDEGAQAAPKGWGSQWESYSILTPKGT